MFSEGKKKEHWITGSIERKLFFCFAAQTYEQPVPQQKSKMESFAAVGKISFNR